MKQSLNIKQGHKLKLTPKLQNAIRLLQLSTIELSQEIHTALETNPFLERSEEQFSKANETPSDTVISEDQFQPLDLHQDNPDQSIEPIDSLESYENQLSTSANNIDHGYDHTISSRNSQDHSNFLENISQTDSVTEHLKFQVRHSLSSANIRYICEVLIDNLDERGYLDLTQQEIIEQLDNIESYTDSDIGEAIHLLQSLEPIGIGARNLQDCLLIQLRVNTHESVNYRNASIIIEHHFELLMKRDTAGLSRATGLSQFELSNAIQIVRTLNFRPLSSIQDTPAQYIVPDLVTTKINNEWIVRLNTQASEHIELSPASKIYLKSTANQEDSLYLQEQYQEAKWLLQSLQQRTQTILRVGEEIIKHQKGFLENGASAMKPLTLKQIATKLELHESTISRTTNQKYISSPHGIHELKYFFSTSLENDEGDGQSSTSIQSKIKQLISKEPEGKPISDQKLADYFKNEGVNVARRTIAKYREQMNIPPSSQRKAFF